MKQLVMVALVMAAVGLGASRAQAMHCQQRLVRVGDASTRVLDLCGQPAEMVERTETRTRTIQRQAPDGTVIYDTVSVTVVVEQWTYDFGPQRFMRRLWFEGGVLQRMSTLGYGTVGHSQP